MADRKYYVLCEQNCKFESMTKEQILTAIQQAVESGEIKDVDTGFVTTIKTVNGNALRFFVGSQSEYEALTEAERLGLFAIITNDTTKEAIEAILAELRSRLDSCEERVGALENRGLYTTATLEEGVASVSLEGGMYVIHLRQLLANGFANTCYTYVICVDDRTSDEMKYLSTDSGHPNYYATSNGFFEYLQPTAFYGANGKLTLKKRNSGTGADVATDVVGILNIYKIR